MMIIDVYRCIIYTINEFKIMNITIYKHPFICTLSIMANTISIEVAKKPRM